MKKKNAPTLLTLIEDGYQADPPKPKSIQEVIDAHIAKFIKAADEQVYGIFGKKNKPDADGMVTFTIGKGKAYGWSGPPSVLSMWETEWRRVAFAKGIVLYLFNLTCHQEFHKDAYTFQLVGKGSGAVHKSVTVTSQVIQSVKSSEQAFAILMAAW